jgi:hypothetical protein
MISKIIRPNLSIVINLVFALVPPLPALSQTSPEPATVKNIALVHGAFADGTSWSKVIPLLQADDTAATRPILALQDGPVLLVGHSWGRPSSRSFGPMFDEKLTVAAWKTKPVWVVISTKDHMLPPATEASFAK